MSIIKSIGRRMPNLDSIRSKVDEMAAEKTIDDLRAQAQKRISKTFFNPLPRSVQKKLNQARNYGQEILEMEQQCSREQRIYLADTIEIVHTLLTNLTRLEEDLEKAYSGTSNIDGDIKKVNSEIKNLKKRLKKQQPAAGSLESDINSLITSKERHLLFLRKLQFRVNESELIIDLIITNFKKVKIEITLITTGEALSDKRVYHLCQELQASSDKLVDLLGRAEEQAVENNQ